MERRHTVYREARLVYTSVPKVANTSIKAALLSTFYPEAGQVHIHKPEAPFEAVRPARIFGEFAGYLRIGFVRNPFDRVVSFYFNKIDHVREVIPPLAALGFDASMTFADAVAQICDVGDDDADGHFRSQHRFLLWRGSLVPTFVGRFETLGADWELVRAVVRRRSKLQLPQLSTRTVSRHEPYASYYTPELADRVAERYRQDLELFGYQFAMPATASA